MTNIKKTELKQIVATLKEAFARSYDESTCRQVVAAHVARRPEVRRMAAGEGTFFQTFRVPSHSSLNIAVKVLKPDKQLGLPLHWETNLEKIRTLQIALVPPMRILRHAEHPLAYVMPYGDTCIDTDIHSPEWLQFTHALSQAGLHLSDVPQMRVWNGIPFVVDWSDLSSL